MNETLRSLYARKSVRAFTDRPIDEADVPTILEAATMAPTAGNQQLYTILRITDPALLAATGGIVQGMSGSPILQDGRIIGAITHVMVNDPAMGYGISIQDMLEAADDLSAARAEAAY